VEKYFLLFGFLPPFLLRTHSRILRRGFLFPSTYQKSPPLANQPLFPGHTTPLPRNTLNGLTCPAEQTHSSTLLVKGNPENSDQAPRSSAAHLNAPRLASAQPRFIIISSATARFEAFAFFDPQFAIPRLFVEFDLCRVGRLWTYHPCTAYRVWSRSLHTSLWLVPVPRRLSLRHFSRGRRRGCQQCADIIHTCKLDFLL
jgi:hypothetical protein